MSALIKDAKISHDAVDIGEPKNIFDGDNSTLIRSESINPFSIKVILKSPIEFDRIRLRLTHDTHEWTLEIADNDNDLNSKSKSYKNETPAPATLAQGAALPPPGGMRNTALRLAAAYKYPPGPSFSDVHLLTDVLKGGE